MSTAARVTHKEHDLLLAVVDIPQHQPRMEIDLLLNCCVAIQALFLSQYDGKRLALVRVTILGDEPTPPPKISLLRFASRWMTIQQ